MNDDYGLPKRIAGTQSQDFLTELAPSTEGDVEEQADMLAAKAVVHYELGQWNEAKVAALVSVAVRQVAS